jgi:hypothetical protein
MLALSLDRAAFDRLRILRDIRPNISRAGSQIETETFDAILSTRGHCFREPMSRKGE